MIICLEIYSIAYPYDIYGQSQSQSWQELGGDTTAYHIKGNGWQGVAENFEKHPAVFWLWKMHMDFMRQKKWL